MNYLRSVTSSVEGLTGLAILGVIGGLAVAAPLIFPQDPLSIVASPLIRPFTDANFPLGTDSLGRDMLAGLVHGARVSLTVGLIAAAAALFIGMVVGTV